MPSPVPISPLSAACTLVSWIREHEREPRLPDCRVSNGLLFWRTYLRCLGGSTLSACISAAHVLVSQAPRPRMQLCLASECTALFPYQGFHFCTACRAHMGASEDETRRQGRTRIGHDAARDGHAALAEPAFSASSLRQYGLGTEDEEDIQVNPDTLHSFDDWIAGQMNAWQRASRKRRFFEGA